MTPLLVLRTQNLRLQLGGRVLSRHVMPPRFEDSLRLEHLADHLALALFESLDYIPFQTPGRTVGHPDTGAGGRARHTSLVAGHFHHVEDLVGVVIAAKGHDVNGGFLPRYNAQHLVARPPNVGHIAVLDAVKEPNSGLDDRCLVLSVIEFKVNRSRSNRNTGEGNGSKDNKTGLLEGHLMVLQSWSLAREFFFCFGRWSLQKEDLVGAECAPVLSQGDNALLLGGLVVLGDERQR